VYPQELLNLVRMNLTAGIGAVTYKRLMARFGSVEKAMAAGAGELAQIPGIGEKRAATIVESRRTADVEGELRLAAEHGVEIIGIHEERYPARLKSIFDPPLVLYVKGTLTEADNLAVAIVGARRCTYYGRSVAEKLSMDLAHSGLTVVSGMARGIDSAGHTGALGAGGRTLAVLGCGLSRIYPAENAGLAERIAASGALISEFPMGANPLAENFPRRNRVISGLSLGVIVVEAGPRSGSLITAGWALEQGREVFAVPGKIDVEVSRGPHGLIQRGAKLVMGIEDVLAEIGPAIGFDGEVKGVREAAPGTESLNSKERAIYEMLSSDPVPIDQIIAQTKLSPQDVSGTLMVLEIRRLVKQLPGKKFARGLGGLGGGIG